MQRLFSFLFHNKSLVAINGYLKIKNGVTIWAERRQKEYIFRYISCSCSDIVEKYKKISTPKNIIEEYPIWVFWAQGFEDAPELVRICNQNLLRQEKDTKIITFNNISDYVEIPQYVYDQVQNKVISKTIFSDILRYTPKNSIYEI